MMKFKSFIFVSILALAVGSALCSCGDDNDEPNSGGGTEQGGGGSSSSSTDKWASLVNENSKSYSTSSDGKTFTYGDHTYSYTSSGSGNSRTVTFKFTNIPSGYTEVKAIYDEWAKNDPYLAVALGAMTMEIYGRNATTGEKCMRYVSVSTAASAGISELKQKFVASSYSPENDPYIQRYLPAVILQGAKPSNAYKPNTPYTIEMKHSVNNDQDYSSTIDGKGYVPIYILTSGGWSQTQRDVSAQYDPSTSTYKMNNYAAIVYQCQTISGTWAGLQ